MDQIGHQEQKAMAEQDNYQTLKKVTKLLFSISLFSFFFAIPSWLPFHLFHSLNLNSPTLRFHLFNQPIDKNSMFLLCNGLLVFLANYSGLFKCLSTSRRNYESFKVYEFESLSDSILSEVEKPLIERETTETAVNSTSFPREILSTTAEERMIITVSESRDVEEANHGLGNSIFTIERVEDGESTTDEEGNGGVLSDEELNKKFDEFIKRMKEEIIVDSRRTLVVV